MDIYWFLRLHDFLWGGGVPSSPPCLSSLPVPVSPTLWVRKLAPVLLPAVALLHPELARPTVLLPTNVSSTVVPAVPATSVLVMSIMVAVPPMEAVVVMVVVVEVPHGTQNGLRLVHDRLSMALLYYIVSQALGAQMKSPRPFLPN